jgi:tRNA (cytidine/uridine-2'-O-)-methyltransferase
MVMVASRQLANTLSTLPDKAPFTVVLVEPRIPQNVGNIARLCVNTGADLWLVGSLGFEQHDKHLHRAGMDYMDKIAMTHVPDWHAVTEAHPGWHPFFLSSKGKQSHFTVQYPCNSLLVFGSESHGLPQRFLDYYHAHTIRIPMTAAGRSLNLASSVAIILYDALKQNAT